ncbi:right-handed parallel beta-helix repeat-containing protein [[Pseudopropionibacterium] massiliense]|uniref:right-handed parallel beta-helix repeat-containing protein n=1 Tax=[Pseudopropionibacterium] massiliense TaxID=2220000 RepID=UPI001FEC66D2|nr:right-handed parallel beta-helix repeat-containing protein [[Pseudopropionibacterium] massiliense]
MGFRKIAARFAGLAAAALLAAGTLVGCVNASDVKAEEPASVSSAASATNVSTASAGTASTTPSAGATSAASTAAGTNTELTSGQVSVTIDGKSATLSGAYVVDGVDAVIDGGTYSSTTADQAVFLVVNGGSLTIRNAEITKSGDTSNEEQSNFYGFNSAVLVAGEGSSATVENTTITTQSSGSNGVVATGGATATVRQTTIETHANSSRGLHATYKGTITGENVAIHTRGAHSATLATDRGNGTVTVTGTNELNTEGDGSPLLYSTGQISASGVTGEAKDSEVVVVEGKNSATLTDSTVTSSGKKAVMLYQSFSGDAHDKDATATRSTFTMTNTKLTANGTDAVLYATNTTTSATLTNVEITSSASVGVKADEDRWGKSGSNGATLHLVLDGTTITGGATAGSSSAITIASTNGGKVEGEVSGSVTNS